MNSLALFPPLKDYIEGILADFNLIDDQRKKLLLSVVDYVKNSTNPKLNFICTHNSRRSHLGQIWAQTAAAYYGIEIETFSGGTEATTFHPNAVDALKRAGFKVENPGGKNPKYEVSFSKNLSPMICFSKKYNDSPNPTSNFAAIMTCSEADAECPVVIGASKRIKLFYEDPKVADNTSGQDQMYDERCRQIATEMFFVFTQVE